ncbi:MAG: hypothetical protein CMK09_02715 [Ponticaulis sp.]|mgnify:CR=1 FL=1|nr:hypothetical protein [Ponticaulis sp.]|tara:strand:- start:10408 stop:10812 length:405 start_codon:yes stop_codon:yes gene_type:complete
MTVAPNSSLERVYGLVKQHEADLAKVQHSGHRVERDVFGDLLADTRAMSHDLEKALESRQIASSDVDIPVTNGTITPHLLIGERVGMKSAYAAAISEFTTKSDVLDCLERHHSLLDGRGQQKLEILCAAILSDQ